MTKKQHYMSREERIKLESYLEAGKSVAWIAKQLGFARQTIYNEIKRGTYLHTVQWWEELRYSAVKGQDIHEQAQRNKGREHKLRSDAEYMRFLEDRMLGIQEDGSVKKKKRYSPAAALAEARTAGYQMSVCVNTIYNSIDQGIFPRLKNHMLWEKPYRRRQKKDRREKKRVHEKLPSIEQRPQEINQREELGHWEMDLVVGPKGSSCCLLTLTERKTREEIIRKLPNKKAASVRRALNKLEREMPDFQMKFKSITTDNGGEFLEYKKLIRSVRKGTRFDIYYCHSYAAWEKGTNENHNRMIRRWLPKGTNLDKVTKEQVAELQDWMNHYPRKALNWKTPAEAAATIVPTPYPAALSGNRY